jgi:hypothetical protein
VKFEKVDQMVDLMDKESIRFIDIQEPLHVIE